MKILDILNGKHIDLICEKTDVQKGLCRVKVYNDATTMYIDNCEVANSTNCFSESNCIHIFLSEGINYADIAGFNEIEIID